MRQDRPEHETVGAVMTDANTESRSNQPKFIFFFTAIVLIGSFLWRLLVPATEYPSRTVQVLTMVFDAGMLLGVLGMRSQARELAPEGSPRTLIDSLAVAAVSAGLGLFAIRFLGGDSAWWTGHWTYALRPR